MSKNFIFLDIDGVLTSPRLHMASGKKGVWTAFDPVAVNFLEKVCSRWPAELVLSSSWRRLSERGDWAHFFGTSNLDNYFHQNWKTETKDADGFSNYRRIEVANWLQDNGGKDYNYLILDDDHEWFDYQEPHLIRTSPEDGMLAEHYRRILEKTQLAGKL